MKPESLIGISEVRQMVNLAAECPWGDFIEVGVYKGGSAYELAGLAVTQGRYLYLCDTFTGIPYQGPHDSHVVGDFADVDFEDMRKEFEIFSPHVEWVKGVFPGSWRDSPGMPPVRIAFAHLDCDQYQSVKEASEWLIPRMVKGGAIWFDDVDRLKGATLAAEEVFGKYGLRREMSHPYVRL